LRKVRFTLERYKNYAPIAQTELFQNPILRYCGGVAFAVVPKTYFMKAFFTTLILAMGLLFSHAAMAQDSSKLNTIQTKVDRSERKEARLRKKAERKQKKASRKEKKLARQENKSARKQRKLERQQRKLERKQGTSGTTAPSQNTATFYKPKDNETIAA
jgi:uncharacterized protein HemX